MQQPAGVTAVSIRHGASRAQDASTAVRELRQAVEQPGLQALFLFCSAAYDLPRLARELGQAFDCPIVACTSAGQIGPAGYQATGLAGASVAGPGLRVTTHLIAPGPEGPGWAAAAAAAVRRSQERRTPDRNRCALLLCDGLAMAEETLAASLYQALGDVPLVGGSAGDDLRFARTFVYWDGQFRSGAAVLAVLESSLRCATFKVQSFRPGARRLVITGADPERRVVHEIDGYPAAEAYAEALGRPVESLDPAFLSAHPLVLRMGDRTYVRSVRTVRPDGSLDLYCAIEEGLVLCLGEGIDPLGSLEEGLARATAGMRERALLLGFDCILRRLDLERSGQREAMSALLARHQVVGFNTYGEQFNGVHVNQTFTGVALGA